MKRYRKLTAKQLRKAQGFPQPKLSAELLRRIRIALKNSKLIAISPPCALFANRKANQSRAGVKDL